MNRVLSLVTLVALFACASVRAQDSADERYVIIYGLIQQADNLATSGEPSRALDSYNQALAELQSFNRVYPQWNPTIVNFRLSYITSKIDTLTATIPATNAIPPAAANALAAPAAGNPAIVATNAALTAANAALQTQVKSIQQQLQAVQDNNSSLEAKLKEALAAQPTAVDARELEKARGQIRDLMKQNDVLQATVNQHNQSPNTAAVSAADAAALTALQKQLAATNDRLQEEAARSARLELENQALNARVKQLLASPAATAALSQENEFLKKELAALKAAPVAAPAPLSVSAPLPASDNPGLNDELANARVTISLLQSNVTVTTLERDALQQRVQQLQGGGNSGLTADKQTAYEGQIRALTDERNTLLAKLGEANKEIYGHKKQDVAARVDQLTEQVATLRARLAVDETQSVLSLSRRPRRFPGRRHKRSRSKNCRRDRRNWWCRRSRTLRPINLTMRPRIISRFWNTIRITGSPWRIWRRSSCSKTNSTMRKSTSNWPWRRRRTTDITLGCWAMSSFSRADMRTHWIRSAGRPSWTPRIPKC